MQQDTLDLEMLVALVEDVATAELLPRYRHVTSRRKSDGSLLTEADLAVQRELRQALQARFPQYALLGEEMSAEEQQHLLAAGQAGLWCLDPLDGTGNFAAGIPIFAVSLALIRSGRVELGVVHDPLRGESFWARRGAGAWLDGERLRVPDAPETLADTTGLVDLKRLPAPLATALATRPPYRSQRSFGSVALDWCWLAAGRCHVYLHGSQRLWDYAAGALVLQEAGGAGGLLSDFAGDWQHAVDLAPRIGLGAANAPLLAAWRRWIDDARQAPDDSSSSS